MKRTSGNHVMDPEKFVMLAIEKLRKPPYKGIHVVFSGLNQAFRERFPKLDPIVFIDGLKKKGKVVLIPVKRGPILYKTKDAPKTQPSGGALALKKMGLT